MPKLLLFFSGALLVPGGIAFGQQAPAETRLATAVTALRQQYTAAFAGLPQLYSGPEYLEYAQLYRSREGHQFFADPEPQVGSVDYQDHHFTEVRLAYDVVRDQVVLSQPTSPLRLRLVNEWVTGFSIANHQFVRIAPASPAAGAIRPGYYELLLDGPLQVLAKRAKYQQEKLTQGGTDVAFLPNDKLFLRKADAYYPVANKRAVLRLLADHSREVAQYIQDHQLRFDHAQFEATTVALARYYVTLSAH